MGSRVLSSFIVAMLLGLAISATAEAQCTTAVTTAVTSRYVLQDIGIVASKTPGLVTDLAYTCPGPFGSTLTGDWWQRADLSTRGPYGSRGYGDEHDLALTGNWDVGPYKLELSAAYYKLAPLGSRDGTFKLYADIGLPFDLGWASITPAGRLVQFVGMGSIPTFTTTHWHMPITVPLAFIHHGVSLTLEPAVMVNLTTPHGQHHTVMRPSASLDWRVTDTWSLSLAGKAAGRHKQFDLSSTFKF